jgi:hypothetical protein
MLLHESLEQPPGGEVTGGTAASEGLVATEYGWYDTEMKVNIIAEFTS